MSFQTVTPKVVSKSAPKPAPEKSQAEIIAELQAQLAALTGAQPAANPKLPTAHANCVGKFDAKTGKVTLEFETRNGVTVAYEKSSSGASDLIVTADLAVVLDGMPIAPKGTHLYGRINLCVVPDKKSK